MTLARSRIVPILIVVGLLGAALVSAVAIRRTAQPTFVPAGEGLALGPAAHHTRAATDVLIHVASGALDSAAGGADGDLDSVPDGPPTPHEQALLDVTNRDRAQHGLPPVAFDAAMLQVARARAAAQIPDGPLSHFNNLGELAFVGMLGAAGVEYLLAGENLARASSQDSSVVPRLAEALMNSPTHRANILEPSFNRLAVGAAMAPDGRIAFAEIFRGAPDAPAQASDTTTTPTR